MPALGMAQDTGKLIRWLKAEGDTVAKGDLLMEVETDKATVEIEAPASGTLANVTAKEGDVVPVAEVIALILAPGEIAPSETPQVEPPTPAATPDRPDGAKSGHTRKPTAAGLASPVAVRVAEEHHVNLKQVKARDGERITKADVLAHIDARHKGGRLVAASPKARRLAAERGLALDGLAGSGPGGAILAADVLAAPAGAGALKSSEVLETSRAWRTMAERLSATWAAVPHFYLARDVDATRLAAWREHNMHRGDAPKITVTDLLIRVAAAALKRHPRVNSSWNGQGITRNSEVNVGLAVAVDEGLLVPVIHQADRLSVAEIATARQGLVERAKAGRLRLDDLQGSTFTLSNLGMYGVDAFNAIINPPEAAILAVGRIADRVVPVAGKPEVRPMLTLTLSCDHRVIDGARGAEFLESVAALIEEPLGLLD